MSIECVIAVKDSLKGDYEMLEFHGYGNAMQAAAYRRSIEEGKLLWIAKDTLRFSERKGVKIAIVDLV